MSLSKNIELKCPKCNSSQNFKVWQSINVTEDKSLKADVFSQDIFKFKCNDCGTESLIEYPFIYHDYDKKFFVYFDPSEEFENVIENEGYKTKVAGNYLEFLELIRILEDNIDEELVNNAKENLFNKFRTNEKLRKIEKIYYSGMEENRLAFFIPEINGKITV